MKKKCLASEVCPLARGYNAIGDWWSLLIVTQILLTNSRRFSEIQEDLGMAKNILTARLTKLLEEDILEKAPASDGSAYQEYRATKKGKDLYKVIVALRQWGETHYSDKATRKHLLVDRKRSKPIPQIEIRSANGEVLKCEDLKITGT